MTLAISLAIILVVCIGLAIASANKKYSFTAEEQSAYNLEEKVKDEVGNLVDDSEDFLNGFNLDCILGVPGCNCATPDADTPSKVTQSPAAAPLLDTPPVEATPSEAPIQVAANNTTASVTVTVDGAVVAEAVNQYAQSA